MGRKAKNGEREAIQIKKEFLKLANKQLKSDADLGRLYRCITQYVLTEETPSFDDDDIITTIIESLFDSFVESDASNAENYAERCKNTKIAKLYSNAKNRDMSRQEFIMYMASKGFDDVDDYADKLSYFKDRPDSTQDSSPEESERDTAVMEWFKREINALFPVHKRLTGGQSIKYDLVASLYNDDNVRPYLVDAVKNYLEIQQKQDENYKQSKTCKEFFSSGAYVPFVDDVRERAYEEGSVDYWNNRE